MIFFKLISRIPLPLLYLIADLMYFLTCFLFGYRKKVVIENLKKSFPEKTDEEIKKIAKGFYMNLADLTVETLKVPSIRKKEIEKRVKIVNIETIHHYMDKGMSTIALTGHQCNWEWLLLACSITLKYPIDAVYKPMHIKVLDRLFLDIRSRFGARPLAMKDVFRNVVRNKNEVRNIAMVADQTPAHSEIQYFRNFLNQNTPFFVGADKIAKHTGYPVMFVEMRRVKRGYYEVEFHVLQETSDEKNTPFPVTDAYAEILEHCIRRHPADWLWSHKRWKHTYMKVVRKSS